MLLHDAPAPDALGARVLVIHRPAYDDWTLPKGHLDPGEGPEEAAVREVEEETGVRARIVAAIGSTEHEVMLADGPASKRVHWFLMHPTDRTAETAPSERTADAEVDTATWWPIDSALTDLTHTSERDLVRRTVDELAVDDTDH